MVVVYVGAGLANRMFQYAFALSLREKGLDVFIDEDSFIPRFDFERTKLDSVFVNVNIQRCDKNFFPLVLREDRFYKLLKRISEYMSDNRYIERWNLDYLPYIHKKASTNCIFIGFWISYKYFQSSEDAVRKAFTFKPLDSIRNVELATKLVTENSVAVHFRKNIDYLKNLPNTCPPSYYYEAINYIKKYVPNPKFYFFSDNWDWVRENIRGVEFTAVDWNPSSGLHSHCDMQLMSLCKHNIIANSTYSWWSAYLNENNNKIVVCPKDWYGGMVKKLDTIIPESWIIING